MESWRKNINPDYTIDLTKIDGEGAFPCPKCGSMISPEDEESHSITQTKVNNDELTELTIQCNKCATTIRLCGFLSQPKA